MGAVGCRRHVDEPGPAWCQDCHGVHEIARPDVVEFEPRPRTEPPWYIKEGRPPELWPGRGRRQQLLRQLLAMLEKAREERAEWYEWALHHRDDRDVDRDRDDDRRRSNAA